MRHQLKLPLMPKRIDKRQNRHLTHEQFIHAVAQLGISKLTNAEDKAQVGAMKLTYGAGIPGVRGITYFNRWLHDKAEQAHFVEICATGEESPVQLAGTTLHELGHVIAGHKAGHAREWHQACARLGLRAIKAAGTSYSMGMFEPAIRTQVAALIARLSDGKPNGHGTYAPGKPRPCSAGIGTRGGTSRGVGSGSRLRKWVCACEHPVIARVSSDHFDAMCNRCYQPFHKDEL